MDYIFEVLMDLIFDYGLNLTKDKRLSKPVRYLIITLIFSCFLLVIGSLFIVGIVLFSTSWAAGLFCVLISLILLFAAIIKFLNMYLNK